MLLSKKGFPLIFGLIASPLIASNAVSVEAHALGEYVSIQVKMAGTDSHPAWGVTVSRDGASEGDEVGTVVHSGPGLYLFRPPQVPDNATWTFCVRFTHPVHESIFGTATLVVGGPEH